MLSYARMTFAEFEQCLEDAVGTSAKVAFVNEHFKF